MRKLLLLLLICGTAFAGEAEFSYTNNVGGLNSRSSALNLADNESSDCQNIEFTTDGAILKCSGSVLLSEEHISAHWAADATHGTADIEHTVTGLYQYQLKDGSDYLITVVGNRVYKMDSLDGQWDHISGDYADSLTSGDLVDFETYLDTCIMTDGVDFPWKYDSVDDCEAMDVPTGLTTAKYVKLFKDYLFFANVTVSGTTYPSRIYWSDIGSITSWTSTHFLNINTNDGQVITGLEVLGDRLVAFKSDSVYNILFTGNSDIPFFVQKSDSDVGCVAGHSIQNIKNNLAFLSRDGLYVYDGLESNKISDKIDPILQGYSVGRYDEAVSANYQNKSQYWVVFTSGSGSYHDRAVVWDYFHNSFVPRKLFGGDPEGISALTIVKPSSGLDRIYSGGYQGNILRQDYGTSVGGTTQTNGLAIDAYYWTKWFDFGSLAFDKRMKKLFLYTEASGDWNLNIGYTYNLENGLWKQRAVNLSGGGSLVGSSYVGTATTGITGSLIKRLDLLGKGDFVRFKFSNSNANEDFRIDGFSLLVEGKGFVR